MSGQCRKSNVSYFTASANLKNSLQSPLCNNIVTLVVGPTKEKITAHRALLAFLSGYFDAAFYGALKETGSEFVMPEACPISMRAFVCWAYTGKIDDRYIEISLGLDDEAETTRHKNIVLKEKVLVSSWCLGDMLIAPGFANEVMYAVADWLQTNTPEAANLAYAYSNTASEAPLWQYLKDVVAVRGPFATATNVTAMTKQGWEELLKEGAEFLPQLLYTSGLSPWSEETAQNACATDGIEKYPQPINGPSAVDWLKKHQ